MSVSQIAALLQRHRSTIYRELKRGTVTNLRSDLSEYRVYRAQRAHDDYPGKSGAGGAKPKLVWNSQTANKLGTLMRINKMSPYAAMETAKREKSDVPISLKSLYNYIHQYNYPIACHQLPMKNKTKKKKAKGTSRLAHHNVKGVSIENDRRMQTPELRQGIGMDLVVGAKGGKKVLLVLTERKHAMSISFCSKTKVKKASSKHSTNWNASMERVYFGKRSRRLPAITGRNFLIINHWKNHARISQTARLFILPTPFRHLSEEVMRMPTASSEEYYPRKACLIPIRNMI